MNSKYKLIALDMDGTLLKSDKTISDSSIESINEALDNNIQVVLCTGRGLMELDDYLNVIPMVRYGICYSGAIVYDFFDKKIIYSQEIKQKYIFPILEVANKYQAMIHFLTETKSIVSDKCISVMKNYNMAVYQKMFEKIAIVSDDLYKVVANYQSMPKINIYFRNEIDREEGYNQLKHLPLKFAYCDKSSLEINDLNVSKATGLINLCKHLNIDLDQTVAIGDSNNDLDVLEISGLSIAMGNSIEKVKSICDYTTSDNDHDGIKQAINYILKGPNEN